MSATFTLALTVLDAESADDILIRGNAEQTAASWPSASPPTLVGLRVPSTVSASRAPASSSVPTPH